jgi:plasmid stability protein
MINISVKDVPDAWADALRRRAARNHRSLQGELMAIIERAANELPLSASEPDRAFTTPLVATGTEAAPRKSWQGTVVGYDRFGHPIIKNGWKTTEQLVAEQRARGLKPFRGGPSSVDMIREDRDSR